MALNFPEGRTVEIGGHRMHVVDRGAGEAIVMVHGNPTWSFYWRHLIDDLSTDHRTIAPDHIGMGRSDKPTDARYDHRLARRIDDLEALLERLEVDGDLTLVLHDWGGMIGLGWAARHPERVARIVLGNTAAFHLPPAKGVPWQLRLARSPLGALAVRGFNAFCRGAARQCVVRPMTPEVRAGYLEPYDSWDHRRAVHRFVQDIPLSPSAPSWEAVSAVEAALPALADKPILILWGEQDFVFDGPFLERWRQVWPAAEVVVYPEAGHYVFEDEHAAIGPAVRDFLARHPIGATAP